MRRNLAIDIARAICIVEIVGWWHLGAYIGIDNENDGFSQPLTIGALATFFFLSGYFLGKKHVSPTKFYRKRLIRFWPLYVISCAAMYLGGGGIRTIRQLLCSITGISVFILPQPPTLWFMAMLMFFYFVTPLLTSPFSFKTEKTWLPIVVKGIIIEVVLISISLVHPIDEKILTYFPFYLFGMVTPFGKFDKFFYHSLSVLLFDIVAIIIILFFHRSLFNWGGISYDILVKLTFAIGILAFSHLLNLVVVKIKPAMAIFNFLSYAGLCTYLFHRHIYKVFKVVFSNSNGIIPLYIAPFMVIGAFLISGIIQKVYDKLTNKIII